MTYCEKCGNKLSENSKFCGSCGHKISNPNEKSEKIEPQSGIKTLGKPSNDNTLSNQNNRSISPLLVFALGVVIIVGIFILFKAFDRKPELNAVEVVKDASDNDLFTEEEIAVAEEGGDIDLIADPEEEAAAYAEEDMAEGDLLFIFDEDDGKFRDGLFNFGLRSKSDLIKDVLQHLRNDNIRGELTGCDFESMGAIDGIGYQFDLASEYDFALEVYQFKNEDELQKSLNEGSLSDFKNHGEIYVNDCIALFITNDYRDIGINTDEISKKIIESFKSFKKGEATNKISNNNDNNEFTYETYRNNRGYQIDYPSFLKISSPVENDDGRSFISSDGETELLVWSSYYAESDNPITERYESDSLDEDLSITYKVKKDSWYILSGFTNAEKIFYKKVFQSEVGAGTVTMYFEYPEYEKERYNSILPHIVESFKDI